MSDFDFRSPFELLVSTTDEYSKLMPLLERSVLPRLSKMVPHIAPGGRLAIVLVAKGDDASKLIRRRLGMEEPGSYPFSAAVNERLQELGNAFEVLSFEANITAETAEKLMEVLVLFPIMQYDPGSTAEQRLALIDEHFKED